MTRSRSPSPHASISQAIQVQENNNDGNMVHQVMSSATLPTTEMAFVTKVPHTRRVSKSKTCYSFLTHQHQQQQQQQQKGDIELATAIGQDLLLEVKKMQALLQEKTNTLTTLALEKADAQQEIDQLTNQLKQRSDTLECSKEQLWTLELEKQEQIQTIDNLQQHIKRTLAEQTKKEDEENKLKQELEHLKQQQVIWQETEQQAKQDKLDLAITRRRFAALQRQVSSNKIMMDASRVSFAGGFLPSSSYATSDTYRFSLPSDPQLNLSHLVTPSSTMSSSVSHPASIAKSVRQQQQQQQDEIIAKNAELQTSLSTANDTIQSLQRSLEDEQKKRMEMETLWREAQEVIENEHGDDNSGSTTANSLPQSPTFLTIQEYTTGLNAIIETPTQARPSRRIFSKEARAKRQKCLSLGDELSLAGPSGILSCFSNGDGTDDSKEKDIAVEEPLPPMPKLWNSEALEPHTNLDNVVALNVETLEPSYTLINTLSSTEQYGHTQQGCDGITSDKDEVKHDESGSLLETQCHSYNSPRIDNSASQQTIDASNNTKDTTNTGNTLNGVYRQRNLDSNKSNSNPCTWALTRTMIGDWMWKYTRKFAGKGISEHKHKRFFWLHPYSKTLYWSSQEPGVKGYRHDTKSVTIESFMVINEGTITSFYIQTCNRTLKIRCADNSTHQDWLLSLKYLLIDIPPTLSPLLITNQDIKKKEGQHQIDSWQIDKLINHHSQTHAVDSIPTNQHTVPESTLSARTPLSLISLPIIKGNSVDVKLA